MDASDEATGPGLCYVRNDLAAQDVEVVVSLLNLKRNLSTALASVKVRVETAVNQFFCLDGHLVSSNGTAQACVTFEAVLASADCSADGSDCMLLVSAKADHITSSNELILTKPANMTFPKCTVDFVIGNPQGNQVDITISTTDGPCLYVWLTTRAHGRFTRNAIVVRGTEVVRFIAFGELDMATLKGSLRIEDLNNYMK